VCYGAVNSGTSLAGGFNHQPFHLMKIPVSFVSAVVSLCAPRRCSKKFWADRLCGRFLMAGDSVNFWTTRLFRRRRPLWIMRFDYSTLGIPAAPNSTGGTTRGMRFSGESVRRRFSRHQRLAEMARVFTGDFRLRFDAWVNFIGPSPAGGNGSTQMATFGWGTNGSSAQWAGATSAVLFAADGDGWGRPKTIVSIEARVALRPCPARATMPLAPRRLRKCGTENFSYYASLWVPDRPHRADQPLSKPDGSRAPRFPSA